jgi:hypothetical protein
MRIALPATIAKKVAPQLVKLKHTSPTVMVGAGLVGLVGSTVLACRATLKLDEVLEEKQSKLEQINATRMHDIEGISPEDYSEKDRLHDLTILHTRTVVEVVKIYAPAAVLGAVSVGLIIGSHKTLQARNAGLLTAYAALDKGYQEYQRRVLEEVGPEKEAEFRRGKILSETVHEDGTKTTVVEGANTSPYRFIFDRNTSKNWSPQRTTNQIFLRVQQQYANDLLNSRGYLFLNDVLDMLGIDRTPAGQRVGWCNTDGGDTDGYVDFGVFDGDMYSAIRFINCDEESVWLDFNVDGVILDRFAV